MWQIDVSSYINEMKQQTNILYNSVKNVVKSFKEVPGPKGPLGLGTLCLYLPSIGVYKWDELHWNGLKNYEKWGSIVCERIIPGTNILYLYDPDDIAKVYNDVGREMYPQRTSHLALAKYRKDRPHIYSSGGLLPTNGSEWWRIRSEFQKGINAPQKVRKFIEDIDSITKEFVSQIQPTGENHKGIPDFLLELSRLNLELICKLAFDVRMNSFSEAERCRNSITSKLIEATETSNRCILPTDQGFQLWRFFETKLYKRFRQAQEYIESVSMDLLSKKSDENKIQPSILEEYFANPNLTLSDIVGMANDILLAGIDTTSYSTSFILYHLAINVQVQDKLYEETCHLLPFQSSNLTSELIRNHASYAKAILKESLRLNPISIGVGRNLNQELILSGYTIPKGTLVVTHNMVICRLEKYFEKPNDFIPERWLKENRREKSNFHPYLVLPFGHGIRACIARHLAEQNMLVLLVRLIRNFKIRWAGSPTMDIKTELINKPDQPIKLIFERRSNKSLVN